MTFTSPSSILVTGATGFVGGAVVLEYLANTDATIFCLTRGKNVEEAHHRTTSALTVAANAYDRNDLLGHIGSRIRTVVGDVCSPGLKLAGLPDSVDIVLHVAASLKYADKDVDEINRSNVGGTANVIQLAKILNARRLCHVSTAYVAGTRTGDIGEESVLLTGDDLNNEYERSKVAGERLVVDCGIDYQIVRPSIVIGHSRTFAATSFSGMYGMLDEVRRFKNKVSERLGSLLEHRGISLLANPSIELNLVPIDFVARAIMRISVADTDSKVFHVANGTPPTAGMCLDAGFDLLGLPRPRFVERPEQLNELDRRLQTDFYDTYLRNGKAFSLKNSEAVIGAGALDFPIDSESMSSFLSWYVDSGQHKGGRLTC